MAAHPSVWRNVNFVRLWSGTVLSTMADSAFYILLPWYVIDVTGSEGAVGGTLLAMSLPRQAFGVGWQRLRVYAGGARNRSHHRWCHNRLSECLSRTFAPDGRLHLLLGNGRCHAGLRDRAVVWSLFDAVGRKRDEHGQHSTEHLYSNHCRSPEAGTGLLPPYAGIAWFQPGQFCGNLLSAGSPSPLPTGDFWDGRGDDGAYRVKPAAFP
jgi:hypothetical protein